MTPRNRAELLALIMLLLFAAFTRYGLWLAR